MPRRNSPILASDALNCTSSHPMAQVFYPAFLNLKGKKVVVIGGGKVAERKILALLKAGAHVTVISPKITKRIEREKRKRRVRYISRKYKRGDQKNALLVIVATDSQDVNQQASREAPCLVNVVDAPTLCNFIVPSVIKRGPLTIAVSTSGVSPALSSSIRSELEELYGPVFAQYLELLEKIRRKAMREIPNRKKRTEFLKSIASKSLVDVLRKKGFKEAKKMLLLAKRDTRVLKKGIHSSIHK